MLILNFIPAIIWQLGFLFFVAHYEHQRIIDGRGEMDDDEGKALAKIAVGSFFLWLLIAIILCVVESA
jgi:hypothetical protein